MGLFYHTLTFGISKETEQPIDAANVAIRGQASIAAFKELVQRGANLWPDAPAEIKEFADIVTNGKILQNYQAQEAFKRKKEIYQPTGAMYGNSSTTTDTDIGN